MILELDGLNLKDPEKHITHDWAIFYALDYADLQPNSICLGDTPARIIRCPHSPQNS